MPWTPDDLLAHLAAIGVEARTTAHRPIFTVDEGREVWAHIPGAHCKNLFLRDESGALFLLVALEHAEIRLNQLHKRIGARRLSFGRPELLFEVLGVAPGSVTPFALVNDRTRRVAVLIDDALLEHELLNFHPLVNDRTTTIRREDLLRFFDIEGYVPRRVDLKPAAQDSGAASRGAS